MRDGARLQAAAEVLDDIARHHRPAQIALSDWGRRHRFAGTRDRSAIGTLVFDVLRQKRSLAWRMGDDGPRALVLAAASSALGLSADQVISAAEDGPHAIGALSEKERAGLTRKLSDDAPPAVQGDIPEWLWASFDRAFGAQAAGEGQALAKRAPIDLRANTLKGNRIRVLKTLQTFDPSPTPHAPDGVRLAAPGPGIKAPPVEREAAHGKGWYEVQDEGSQLAALLSGAGPRMQVLDLCAGAGGKTLALAAQMQNTGQLFAYDKDKTQLRPIFDRIRRAGVRNVQVLEAGDVAALNALGQRFDVVLIDAPCSGTGTWRRRPDSKWRLSEAALHQRIEDQRAVLQLGADLVKPGGRLVYVTCSVLPEENTEQTAWFQAHDSRYDWEPHQSVWQNAIPDADPAISADGRDDGLLLTPARHGTDGFYIARFLRRDAS